MRFKCDSPLGGLEGPERTPSSPYDFEKHDKGRPSSKLGGSPEPPLVPVKLILEHVAPTRPGTAVLGTGSVHRPGSRGLSTGRRKEGLSHTCPA